MPGTNIIVAACQNTLIHKDATGRKRLCGRALNPSSRRGLSRDIGTVPKYRVCSDPDFILPAAVEATSYDTCETLQRYARDTWASFVAMTDENTGLPADSLHTACVSCPSGAGTCLKH
jgi:hypothetical protein